MRRERPGQVAASRRVQGVHEAHVGCRIRLAATVSGSQPDRARRYQHRLVHSCSISSRPPHTSQVKGTRTGIRELRPRSGRSPWRALYRRVGGVMVILAVGPEAEHDRRGSTGQCGGRRRG